MSFSRAGGLGMTPAGGGEEPELPSGASYRRASASFRRRSSHHADASPRGSHVIHRRTDAREEAPHATKKDMASYVRKLEQQFTITPQRMRMIVDAFIDTLDRGLAKDKQMVPMIPTYVHGWPTGEEKGPFLAIDLGGTNLRVCQVTLEGHGKFEIVQSKYKLTDEQKLGPGQDLIDFAAECVASFIADNYGSLELDEKLSLGFTFSYPCVQNGIDHAELIRWTKGFGAPDVEGHDVVNMLRKSVEKFKIPVEIVACINDTTGTLIASHYVDPSTRMGIIFGTGCNAAYMETIENVPKLAHMGLPGSEQMAINCEWGAFDSEGKDKTEEFGGQSLPRTPYDIRIDEESNKPGEQAFEKMIAGNYLGEIFRQVIVEMIDEGVLFLGQNAYKIEKRESFDTAFLSLIESDTTDELLTVTGLFTHFFGLETTLPERQFFRRLAQLIGTRSARLSACGIAAIASKMGYVEKGCGVATDGSLYSKYPKFADRLGEALVDIFGEKGKGIKTYHAEDGSGVGAAIIAAMTQARLKAAAANGSQ